MKLFYTTGLALFFAGQAISQEAPEEWSSTLQNIVNDAADFGQVDGGVILGVYVPGEWSWQGAAGFSRPEIEAQSSDKFRIGSISKMFTAIAILQLEEQGLLNTSDSINIHIRPSLLSEDTITNGHLMTIEHLLNHTSGYGNSSANNTCQQDALNNLEEEYTYEEAFVCGNTQGPYCEPGNCFEYSNTNFTLLAMIIENVSGIPYDEYITQNIIIPANLTNTEIPLTSEISESHMGCYWWVLPFWKVDMTIVNTSLYRGWASVVSTTEDMMFFMEKLRNGEIISANSWNKMNTVVGAAQSYGLGLEKPNLGGYEYIGHAGEVGNTSGLYYCNVSSACAPNGYYISYNINYARKVDFFTMIDAKVQSAIEGCLLSVEEPTIISDISLSPNPASDKIELSFDALYQEKINIHLISIEGRSLPIKKNEQIQQGMNKFIIPLTDLSTGMYLLEIQTGKSRITKKIMVN